MEVFICAELFGYTNNVSNNQSVIENMLQKLVIADQMIKDTIKIVKSH